MTAREFLGDDNIKKLEGLGFSPLAIRDLARKEYETKKQSLIDRGINESVAAQGAYENMSDHEIEQMNDDASRGWIRRGWDDTKKAVLETANAYSKFNDYGKDIENYLNKKISGDEKAKFEQKTKSSLSEYADKEIKRIDKADERWAQAHPGEWNVAGLAGGLVGGFIDPINFIPLGSSAKWGKKILYYAGTGAAAGGVSAYGGDRDVGEGVVAGAVGGAILGPLMEYGVSGISKLIAKRQASRVANEANAIDSAQNSEFLDGSNNASGDVSSGNGSLEYPNTQSIAVTIVRGVLKNEPLSTREQVLKEILSGEEKSSVIKPEKYKSILTGINEYKSYQNRLKHFHDNPDEVKNADLVFDQMQDSFIKANSGDTKKYYDAAPLFGRELKIAQTMTAKEFAIKEVGLDEDTATNVLKEAMQGKEKSEFIDADSYNDIVKFKNFEVQREHAKAYGEKIQTAQTSINKAREQSAIRYADTQKAINEYAKQGMSASATRELINAKFKPSADEINYTRAYNDGADVDARLTGQGIFYALEKDIAAQAYTPEIYATRLKQRGFSDESVQAFTQAYANKDINIAKEYVNEKVANTYESRVQREVADEINAKNRISINKDGAYSGHPMLRPDEPSIGQGDLKNDYTKIVKNIASDRNIALRLDPSADVLAIVKDFSQPIKTPIFTSKISVDKMLNHLADKADGERRLEYINLVKPTLENPLFITQETINGTQRFRFFKTFIDDKDKVVKFLNVVEDKNGELLEITATPIKNTDLKNLLKGKIIWGGDALSDLSSPRTAKRGSEADVAIISQKGNLINEEAKNSALPNGVSGIGDNASRTGGRQGGDEEILRQSGRNTADASEEKWTAKSDRQMEQRPAFKRDGDTDATASSKQMVEKQGRDDNEIRGDGFVLGDSGKAKQYATQKFNVEKWVNDLSGVISDEWVANLKSLAVKHPEMFKSESDVFKVIREIKNEPTHFLKNTRDDVALIAKRLGGGKVGNIGVKKDNGQIIHANKTDERDLTRLLKRGKKGELTRTPALETSLNKEDGELLKLSDENIIPQKKINAKTINANSHIASGLVGGTLNSIDEDGSFNPEKFAAGFIAGLAGSKAVAIAARKMTPQLYNKILGVANKMPQMAKDNPKLLGKLYQNAKDASLNSFAGEKAITANVGKLDQAKAMLEKGADEVEIWQKTGWFKDEIDDKWKFEINPRGGELKPNPPRNTVLYNVLNDEKLYDAYPELQLYKVEIASEYNPMALKALGSSNGGFIPSQKTFIINEKTTDFKSTLYHEIQHAIQEIEGFSAGASGKDGKYWLTGGEAEARNVQKRMRGVSYDGFKSSASMEFFPYKEEAQLQRMAGDKEFMEYHELSKKFDDYLNDNGDNLSAKEEARLGELYEKIKDRLGFTEDDYKKGYELYLKENTGYQEHPLHTLDAPRSERVNMDRGDLNLSKELEKKYILKDGSINEAAVRKEAEPFIEKEYSLENFKAEFPNGKVDTPVGEVSIESRQFNKLKFKGRENFLGLIKPTLERPAFVVDFEDTTFFFKPFRDKDGVIKFASVIKERDGGLDVVSNYPMKNRKFELITREGKVRYVQGSVAKPVEHSLDDTVRSSAAKSPIEHSSDGKDIIPQNEEKIYHSRKIEEIKQEHPDVEKELDESIAAMRKESFNDVNFKDDLISKINAKDITTKQLGKSVDLSDKQLAVLKNDIKNADFKVISDSKIYFDKMGRDGDKKRFFIDIAEDGKVRVDGYSKKGIDTIPVRQSALEELAGVGDRARLKNMSFEVKAAYFNELDPIKKEAILKTAELNKLKKAAQSGDNVAVAKFEEFKTRNLDENGNIKDGLSLC